MYHQGPLWVISWRPENQALLKVTLGDQKVLWSNEVLDGCSKYPLVMKTKDLGNTSRDLVNLVTQILTHRYLGDITSWNLSGFLWMSALITREPKQDLNITKWRFLILKVRFGHLSVTLSNAGYARKCVGKYYTLSILMTIDYGLRGCFRPDVVIKVRLCWVSVLNSLF